jgi:hypothetical protein
MSQTRELLQKGDQISLRRKKTAKSMTLRELDKLSPPVLRASISDVPVGYYGVSY